MLLAKIIAIVLSLATLICLAKWLASQKEHWGIATIINVLGFAIMIFIIKFAN